MKNKDYKSRFALLALGPRNKKVHKINVIQIKLLFVQCDLAGLTSFVGSGTAFLANSPNTCNPKYNLLLTSKNNDW